MRSFIAFLGRRCRSPGACLFPFWTAVGLLLAVTTLVVVFNADRSEFRPERTIDLSQPQRVHDLAPRTMSIGGDGLRVAVAPVISPEASLEMYGDLVAYVARKLDRRPVFLRGESYSEVNDLIRMRQCDMAMVCTYSYVLARSELGVRLLAVPEIDGKRVYYSLIVVPAASKASGLSDLRGWRFASSDVLSCSGWLYPMARLKQDGFDATRFFSEHVTSGSHDRSVFAVRSGVVDAAAVDSLVYEQMVATDPDLGKALKVIERSPPFGMPPFVVPADVPREMFEGLQHVLFDMHRDADGRKILHALGFDRFLSAEDEEYASVRKLHELWQRSP